MTASPESNAAAVKKNENGKRSLVENRQGMTHSGFWVNSTRPPRSVIDVAYEYCEFSTVFPSYTYTRCAVLL